MRYRANGAKVHKFRSVRGWTQSQLAKRAGYTVKTIWKAEASGQLKPQTLSDLAVALDVELSEIVDEFPAPRRTQLAAHKRLILDVVNSIQQRMLPIATDMTSSNLEVVPPKRISRIKFSKPHKLHNLDDWLELLWAKCPSFKLEVRNLVAEDDHVDLHAAVSGLPFVRRQRETFPVCVQFSMKKRRISRIQLYLGD